MNAGPRMLNDLKFGPPPATSMRKEYGALECTIEVVDDVNDAIEHIHRYGSGHTDSIVTDNGTYAQQNFSFYRLLKTLLFDRAWTGSACE